MPRKQIVGSKTAINSRIPTELVNKLDALAAREGSMWWNRSRSQLMAMAVKEFVERHGKPGGRSK